MLAKGLEIELARALAKRLGVPKVRFVNEPFFSTLVSGRPADWDLAIAAITITPERARRVDFSTPYLAGDQAVLMRKGFAPVPTSIAGLRGLQLCSERATTGARAIVERIKPTKKPRLVANPSQLTYDLYNDRCDAIVFDTAALGAARAAAPERYGPFAGRIDTRESYGARVPEGESPATERERGPERADPRRHGRAAAEALALRRRGEAPRPALAAFCRAVLEHQRLVQGSAERVTSARSRGSGGNGLSECFGHGVPGAERADDDGCSDRESRPQLDRSDLRLGMCADRVHGISLGSTHSSRR